MKYKVTFRKTMLDKAFENVLSAKTLTLGVNPTTKQVQLYVDNTDAQNAAGTLVGATDDTGASVHAGVIADLVGTPINIPVSSFCKNAAGLLEGTIEERKLVRNATVAQDAVTKAMQRTIDEGIYTAEEAEERLKVMRDDFVPDEVICAVFDQAKICTDRTDPEHRRVMPKKPEAIYREENKTTNILNRCLVCALSRKAAAYSGDKSVGKNVCAETVAWLLGKPFFLVTLDKKTSLTDLAGDKTTKTSELSTMTTDQLVALRQTDPEKAQAVVDKGQTIELTVDLGPIAKALNCGGFLMFNEWNMGSANTLQAVVNPMIDGTGFVELPAVGRLYVGDAIITACENPGYEGACQHNKATISRMACIRFPNPKDITKQLKAGLESYGITDEAFEQVNALYKKFYAAVHNGSNALPDEVLNIRGFKSALQMWAKFPTAYPLNEAIKDTVAGWIEDEQALATTLAYIDDTISTGRRTRSRDAR